jgi:hypothetical protein
VPVYRFAVCTNSTFNDLRSLGFSLTFSLLAGLIPRTFGIAPEKALKMQAWVMVGRWVDRHVDNPTITKWMLAGASAGAATSLIGETSFLWVAPSYPVRVCVCVCFLSNAVPFNGLTDSPFDFPLTLSTHFHAMGSSLLSSLRRVRQDKVLSDFLPTTPTCLTANFTGLQKHCVLGAL